VPWLLGTCVGVIRSCVVRVAGLLPDRDGSSQ
jgi:hypothetical protein